MLKITALTKDSKDFKEFKKLYHSAFPRNEQIPLNLLLAHPSDSEMEVFYYNNEFCGFYFAILYQDVVNIMFLAVEPEFRDHHFGSHILDHIKDRHKGKRIIVDIELPEENADNENQRLKRKQFYFKNGFIDTNILYNWHGTDYEMLCYGSPIITKQEYENFMNHLDHVRKKEMD